LSIAGVRAAFVADLDLLGDIGTQPYKLTSALVIYTQPAGTEVSLKLMKQVFPTLLAACPACLGTAQHILFYEGGKPSGHNHSRAPAV
jgi:hypothetical protein